MALLDLIVTRNPLLAQHRAKICRLGAALLEACEVDFYEATHVEQALVGAFFFGMVYAHGTAAGLPASQVHALALQAYGQVFTYTSENASQAARACIEASGLGSDEPVYAIVQRGVDGYVQYESGDRQAFRENIQTILAEYREGPRAYN